MDRPNLTREGVPPRRPRPDLRPDVLEALRRHGPLTTQMLAKRALLSPNAAHMTVRALVEEGLVVEKTDFGEYGARPIKLWALVEDGAPKAA